MSFCDKSKDFLKSVSRTRYTNAGIRGLREKKNDVRFFEKTNMVPKRYRKWQQYREEVQSETNGKDFGADKRWSLQGFYGYSMWHCEPSPKEQKWWHKNIRLFTGS